MASLWAKNSLSIQSQQNISHISHILIPITTCKSLVAYFCHNLSDNYVDLSDLYVDLLDHYVDLSDLYVDLSLIHLLKNKSQKRVLAQLMSYT